MSTVRTYIGHDGELYERVPHSALERGDELDSLEETANDDGAPA